MQFLANYINGRWVDTAAGKHLQNVNPSNTDHVIHEFADSQPADVTAAIDAAQAAFPAWSAMPAQKRGAILLKAADALQRRFQEATEALSREMGKPIRESRGEVGRSVDLLRYYAGAGWRLAGSYFNSDTPGESIYTVPVPLGVVTLITPWNFPSAIPVWKMAPALVTGNTVVLKPAQPAPTSSIIIAECLHEAGLPHGVLNVVCGRGRTLSDALVTDPRVRAVSFTGSCGVGNALYKKAATPQRRVGLEMGGKNPLLVMDDADLDLAVRLAIQGAMASAGQKCTATSRAIVHEKVLAEYSKKLIDAVRALKIGDPLDEATDIGPVVNEEQLNTVLDYVRIGKDEDRATLAIGGQRLGGAFAKGCYVSPAVFTDVEPQMRIAQEEIFGPVLAVMAAKDFDHAMDIANDVAFGLSAAICTRSLSLADQFVRRIQAGLVHINNPTAGAQVHVPFGGSKASSSGHREMGTGGLDFFTTVKTVYLTP